MKISSVGRQQNNINTNLQKNEKIKRADYQEYQSFKGGISNFAFNMLDKGFSILDKNPMIQVSFVDSAFTDIPRTLVDLKTGLAAALETMRREFSGLIVNCLMPGFIVKGVAKLLPKAEELKGTDVVGSWANSDAIEKLKSVYTEAQKSGVADTTKEYVSRALNSIEGLEGTKWIKYSDKASNPEFQEAILKVTEAISSDGKNRKTLLKEAQSKIAGLTKAEGILKFNGTAHSNLEEALRDIADMGSKFEAVKKRTISSLGVSVDDIKRPEVYSTIEGAIDKYAASLNKMVNKKSIIGMAVVIAIAVSVQKINRAITKKQFKAEGAPIYKDFGKKDTTQKMNEQEKKTFFAKKVAAALGMYGLAALSMMKKPSLKMFQFSGIFPTLDQCRWIASSTFASRMLAAEDENELRESTVRDVASFAGLYFLGDYAKKSVASGIEAFAKTKTGSKLIGEEVVLLNRKKEVAKPVIEKGAAISKKILSSAGYRAKQFGNWVKNTELKTAAEVSSINVRNMRNICRVADILFSFLMLGIFLPKYNRKVTERKVEEAKRKEEMKNQAANSNMPFEAIPDIFKDLIQR